MEGQLTSHMFDVLGVQFWRLHYLLSGQMNRLVKTARQKSMAY